MMGNHRDAWMFGATDASSGTSVMMETAAMFSELMKTGEIFNGSLLQTMMDDVSSYCKNKKKSRDVMLW